MVKRGGFFPIVLLLATALVPATVRAAAEEEPVATALIPPLPAQAPSAPKAAATPTAAKPVSPPAAKPGAGLASRKTIEQQHRAAHQSHRKTERRRMIAQVAPPRPAAPPRYFPGPPMPGPQAVEGPSLPPPWYDRGRPLAFYPYPGPRGPMPPW